MNPKILSNGHFSCLDHLAGSPIKCDVQPMHFKKPLFYSFLIHLIVILSLIVGVYRPDQRPLKEFNYLVVDLGSLINAEPKGPEKGLSGIQIFEFGVSGSIPELELAALPKKKISSNLPVADPEEFSKALAEGPVAEDRKEENPPVFHEALKPGENPLEAIKESLDRQIQMGQYRFMMRLNPQIAAVGVKHFYNNVHEHVLRLLQRSFSEETIENLLEKAASVEIFYDEDGGLQRVAITSESDHDLADLLNEKIQWNSVAPPAKFGLPNKAVKLHIGIDHNGKFDLNVNLL